MHSAQASSTAAVKLAGAHAGAHASFSAVPVTYANPAFAETSPSRTVSSRSLTRQQSSAQSGSCSERRLASAMSATQCQWEERFPTCLPMLRVGCVGAFGCLTPGPVDCPLSRGAVAAQPDRLPGRVHGQHLRPDRRHAVAAGAGVDVHGPAALLDPALVQAGRARHLGWPGTRRDRPPALVHGRVIDDGKATHLASG